LLDQPKALPELTNSIENGKVVRKNETKNQGLHSFTLSFSKDLRSVAGSPTELRDLSKAFFQSFD